MAVDVLLHRIGYCMDMLKKSLCLLLCIWFIAALPSCDESGESSSSSEKSEYTLEIKTEGGMPMSEIGVYIYKDSTQTDLIYAAETDENGKIAFFADKSVGYIAILSDVPEGYKNESAYLLSNYHTVITPETVLLDSGDMTGYTYELGSVIRDFTVTASNGTEYKISELLDKKKAVVLNFWFLNCGPCKMEFPYLQQAYEEYSDDIEIIAINPVDGTNKTISAYAEELGLSFPMAVGEAEWQNCMKITGYPTTVVIDRYGTICMIHMGSITDKETFTKIFEYFTTDDYKQKLIKNISNIEQD